MRIYTEEELNMNKGGNTDLCPFDCECCFWFIILIKHTSFHLFISLLFSFFFLLVTIQILFFQIHNSFLYQLKKYFLHFDNIIQFIHNRLLFPLDYWFFQDHKSNHFPYQFASEYCTWKICHEYLKGYIPLGHSFLSLCWAQLSTSHISAQTYSQTSSQGKTCTPSQ